MAICKTCKNCALYGNTWSDVCSSPRQINEKGDCIWWEGKDFWSEVCAKIDESKEEPYIGKHIKIAPLKQRKHKIPVDNVRLAFADGGNR